MRTAYLPPNSKHKFKQPLKQGTQRTRISSVLQKWGRHHQKVPSVSPLSWLCNSHRAPQWGRKWVWGIVSDINPPKHCTSPEDPTQTDKDKGKKQHLFAKGKLHQLSWLPVSLLSLLCSALLCSLVILWDPFLPSWIPIIVQLHGCHRSATHASGTVNKQRIPVYKPWHLWNPPAPADEEVPLVCERWIGRWEI